MIQIYILNKMDNDILNKIKKRSQTDIENVKKKVIEIINNVKVNKDKALIEYTKKWDNPNFELCNLKVSEKDIKEAYETTPKKIIQKIKEQITLSTRFHKFQRDNIKNWERESEEGIILGEKWTPIEEAGLYIPGGKNPFPTVQQILAVAAKTAGCKRIVSCISPKGKNYEVIIAANECGIKEIYRVGGAQAIAAMTFGTETIKPVQLIAGPGNPYVTAAKILCQEKVSIDMPAGPSEAIILADDSTKNINLKTKATYCAADLLARAEHGPDSAGVLVTDSQELAELTKKEIEYQFDQLERKDYIKKSLLSYCAIIVTQELDDAIDFTNDYAPEHLEILTENPRQILNKIKNAGSVFLGLYNPVAAGDYASGINHILPTGTWANRTSAVGVWTFMKRIQYSEVSKTGLKRLQPIVDCLADIEGLDAHKKSVDIRLDDEVKK
ncbi:histidinol dehydrogenase [Candidatus Woesearchaeota archaeon]|nr:histidinol dehydrogenase [Candidatus Woesearchaeota archaeon]